MNAHWVLPRDLLPVSVAIMRPSGTAGSEGLALWLGTADGARIAVTHAVEVHGPGFKNAPLYLSLSLRAMAVLTELADQQHRFLVGQIHSHPGLHVGLSRLDERQGIRSPDYLSVVCPHYAQRALSGIHECGVHVFERQKYRRLLPHEVDQRLAFGDGLVTRLRCEVPA